MHQYFVYILASKKRGTLYTGVTNDLRRRTHEHKDNIVQGFTSKYGVHKLVYFERFNDVNSAIVIEKRIKVWKRRWKLELIEKFNPNWNDLFEDEIAYAEFSKKRASTVFAEKMDSKSSLE